MRFARQFSYSQLLAVIPGLLFATYFLASASGIIAGRRFFTLFDDAMISMTYARTLATTGEWVWYPGAEAVQGITNPLWSAYMALLHVFGLDGSGVSLAVGVTGIVFLAISALLASTAVRLALASWRYGTLTAAIAGGAVPFLYPLVFWSVRGMEVGLLSVLASALGLSLVLAAKRIDSGQGASGLLIVAGSAGLLGILTRLDFIVIVGVSVSLTLMWVKPFRQRAIIVCYAAIPVLIGVIGVLILQYLIWGDFMPNTYRLKVDGFSLLERIDRGVLTAAKVAPLLVAGGIAFAVVQKKAKDILARHLVQMFFAAFVAMTLYSVWAGGDAWEVYMMANRYISVALVGLVIVLFIGAATLAAQATAIPRSLGILAALMLMGSSVGVGVMSNPVRYDMTVLKYGVFPIVAGTLALLAMVWVLRRFGPKRIAEVALLSLTACLVLAATSSLSTLDFLRNGQPQGAATDLAMTENGVLLKQVTKPSATIATLFAGAPAYYSERAMIDLLGKSDRTIATMPQAAAPAGAFNSDFYPGHNKWDLDYSVGELRPDVVFQHWGYEGENEKLAGWGYVEFCLPNGTPSLFLKSSDKVLWSELEACSN